MWISQITEEMKQITEVSYEVGKFSVNGSFKRIG